MKILLICKTLPHTFKGGIQTHTWQLGKYLTERGHHVSILTAGSWRKGVVRRSLDGRNLIELPHLPFRKLPGIGPLADEWAFNVQVSRWVRRHQHEFDIVHLQGRSGSLLLEYHQKLTKPAVTTFHGFIENEYKPLAIDGRLTYFQKLHQRFATYLEDLAMTTSDRLIAVSSNMRGSILGRHQDISDHIEIINNGIEISEIPASTSVKAPGRHCVFVGRLAAPKDLRTLLRAMALTAPDITLNIVGDGPDRTEIEYLITELMLQKRVKLLGSKPSDEVTREIDKSDVLILSSAHETQGIVLMEANARQKPVIATDLEGTREVVQQGKNGMLVPYGDVHALASSIEMLLDTPALAQKIGQNGREIMIERFDWAIIAAQTEKLYQKLLSN